MYAIIDSGGKQYRVVEGQRLAVEKLAGEVGDKVTFDNVLLVGGEGEASVGTPSVSRATVQGTIEEHGRAAKIVVFKFKRRKMYRRKRGHRQDQTLVRIDAISVGAGKAAAPKKAARSKKADSPAEKADAASGKGGGGIADGT